MICFRTSQPNEAKKFIESRFPDVVVVSTDLIGEWADDDISAVLDLPNGVKLVIEIENISCASLINLVNTFKIDKFIKIGGRENSTIIKDSMDFPESNKDQSQVIDKLEKKIAHYEYVMEQYLIEN